jgi:N-acetylglucosaminyldiphosphoundecaprenol N-acetyl-beta-D-mannosaminyltransferase
MALVGIGAVFDWVAGNVAKAPEWMQRAGLEWMYRLIREPRRLWQRYLWNNPAFLALLVSQLGRTRLRRR